MNIIYGKPFYYLFYKSDIKLINISDILYNI